LLLLLGLALCLRLVFLQQAFQLDDPSYLGTAEYTLTDPWHPSHFSLVFLGELVSMRGHPHPPLDAWFLGLAIRLTGQRSEPVLHACYLLFTLISVAAMYALARRFTRRPVLATLLFIATPAFVVHGNGIESDFPLLALWLAAAAAFIYGLDQGRRWLLALAAAALALAALAADQVIVLAPVLAFYAWRRERSWRAAVLACATPAACIAGYQLYERFSGGTLPAEVFLTYVRQGGLQSLGNKLKSALALTGHLGWQVFPLLALAAFARPGRLPWLLGGAAAVLGAWVDPHPLFWLSFGAGVVVAAGCLVGLKDTAEDAVFLRVWVLVFYAGALVIFYAGAARYLLPLTAPVAMLVVLALEPRPRWLAAAFLLQFALSLLLALSHYQWAGAYREFARQMAPRIPKGRTFINGEWGFKYYGQRIGGRPLMRATILQPGDWVLTSRLGFPLDLRLAPGAERVMVAESRVVPRVPLRVIGREGRSAFSTITYGVRPFGLTSAPADVLTAERIVARSLTLSYVPMNSPEADYHLAGGLYALEQNRYRWTAARAALLLKKPAGPSVVQVELFIPDQSPSRRVSVTLDGQPVVEKTFPGPGAYVLVSGVVRTSSDAPRLEIAVDRTFSAPGDQRQLGIVLTAAGFKPAN
jgi:4-amino-4-deoxy-L-arabinose transferase-like glycosyltransferase